MGVTIEGKRAKVEFSRFDLESYRTFIACKKLPQKHVSYDWRADTYTLETDARFADRIGGAPRVKIATESDLASHLFDYQRHFTAKALDCGRYALFADCGLGKSPMQLEYGRQVQRETKRRFLWMGPNGAIPQLLKEKQKFYGDDLQIRKLTSRCELEAWLAGDGDNPFGITNFEKLDDGPLPELASLGGISIDESSMLKTGAGKRKWNLIHSCKGIEYKLSNTATPAPNEAMEYASQASFLEMLRSEGEILWTFFTRREGGDWEVKPHARKAFYQFLSSFSVYLRHPANYGFKDNLATVPDPEWLPLIIDPTPSQTAFALETFAEHGAGLFGDENLGIVPRTKLSQAAKGFVYNADKSTRIIPSHKPRIVGALARQELKRNTQTIIWTVFDAEADILAPLLPKGSFEILDGRIKNLDERERIIERTETGDTPILIAKASMMGFGRNFQQFGAMIFSGFNDSFEQMYQAVRRAVRYGQTQRVRIHIPYIPELEGLMFDNVEQKSRRFEAEALEMELCYREALGLGRAS